MFVGDIVVGTTSIVTPPTICMSPFFDDPGRELLCAGLGLHKQRAVLMLAMSSKVWVLLHNTRIGQFEKKRKRFNG